MLKYFIRLCLLLWEIFTLQVKINKYARLTKVQQKGKQGLSF